MFRLFFIFLSPLVKGGKGDYDYNMKCDYLPYNKKLKEKARRLRNNMTAAEKKLWYEYLRNHKYIFKRQKPIDNYIVDFYCSKLKLVIEIDGETHLSKKEKEDDKERTRILESYGLKVLRFWNDDVLNGIEVVSEIIEEEIRKIKSPQPPLSRGSQSPQPPLSRGRKSYEFKECKKTKFSCFPRLLRISG